MFKKQKIGSCAFCFVLLLFSGAVNAAYEKVHKCDQLAGHPKDPSRMAKGVKFSQIVPRPALMACARAVKSHPDTVRFIYQLGRAYESSGQKRKAFKYYKLAADKGYVIANYNLGWAYAQGTGTSINYPRALSYFERSVRKGGPGANEIRRIMFSPEGYSNEDFMKVLYIGELRKTRFNKSKAAKYLHQFTQLFENTSGCKNMISGVAMTKLLKHTQVNLLTDMMALFAGGGQRSGRDWGASALDGYSRGRQFSENIVAKLDRIKADAKLFHNRHGCHTPVAKRMFAEIDAFARGVSGPSFTDQVRSKVLGQ